MEINTKFAKAIKFDLENIKDASHKTHILKAGLLRMLLNIFLETLVLLKMLG